MKCNKCGEEYKDNQAFCLKCGNPIHVVPDFNLIEAELANSVGALMDEDDNDDNHMSTDFDGEEMKTVDVPIEDINMELKMVDISRGRFNFDNDKDDILSLIDDEEDEDEYIARRRAQREARTNGGRPADKKGGGKKGTDKEESNGADIRKNVLIVLACIVSVIVVVILLKTIISNDKLNDSQKFQEQYKVAEEYYNDDKKTEAIAETKKAINVAHSSKEILKARKLLDEIYVKYGINDQEYLDNLKEIVKLEDSNPKYNLAILEYYYNNQMFDEFNVFFSSLEAKGITEDMKKYLPTTPTVDVEGGHYDTHLKITVTADEGDKVYYTLDGNDPKDRSKAFVYSQPISIENEGTTVLKMYAEDVNGIMSEVAEITYVISNVEIAGPVVKPSSGVYEEYCKIEVEIPEGSRVYYTTDGTEPTSSSTEYKEPFDMPLGRTDFQFVSINANGVVSSITSVTYNLSIPRNLKISEAETKVMDKCIKDKELNEVAEDADGNKYTFLYKSIEVIDNAEYYIIHAECKSETATICDEYYAINTNTEDIYQVTVGGDGQYILPEIEE